MEDSPLCTSHGGYIQRTGGEAVSLWLLLPHFASPLWTSWWKHFSNGPRWGGSVSSASPLCTSHGGSTFQKYSSEEGLHVPVLESRKSACLEEEAAGHGGSPRSDELWRNSHLAWWQVMGTLEWVTAAFAKAFSLQSPPLVSSVCRTNNEVRARGIEGKDVQCYIS